MIRNLCCIALCMFFVSTSVYSKTRVYEAPLTNSQWTFASSTGNKCKLSHDIPFYGRAEFISVVGGKQNMDFSLTLKRNQPTSAGVAILKSVAPDWKPEKPTINIGTVTVTPGIKPLSMKNAQAWRLLTELEQGMSPTFYYDGWIDGKDKVVVVLSTVRFFDVYDQFLSCLDQSPSLDVKKIDNAVIHFESDKYTFTKNVRAKLESIYSYVKENDVELVLISGHTDNEGAHQYNDVLSKKRANAVSDFFIKEGVNASKIKIQSYGERNPVDDNATNKGRAKNRRVLIKIS